METTQSLPGLRSRIIREGKGFRLVKAFVLLLGITLSGCANVDPAPSEPSVEVFRPGTFNLAIREEPATTFFVRLTSAAAGGTFEVSGPTGWNGGEPATFARTAEDLSDELTVLYLGAEAMTGEYTLKVSTDKGNTSTTAILETLDLLPTPQDVTVTASSSTEVSATWDAVAGAVSYEMLIREDASTFTSPVLGSIFVQGPSATLTGLSLPAGKYAVEVSAYPIDFASGIPTEAPNFNISYNRSEPFTVE